MRSGRGSSTRRIEKSGFVEVLLAQRADYDIPFVGNKAYPMRGSCPSGRESAFRKADGKRQGRCPWTPEFIKAPARTHFFCFRSQPFQLLSCYTGKVSDAITGARKTWILWGYYLWKLYTSVSIGPPAPARVFPFSRTAAAGGRKDNALEASWHCLSGQ